MKKHIQHMAAEKAASVKAARLNDGVTDKAKSLGITDEQINNMHQQFGDSFAPVFNAVIGCLCVQPAKSKVEAKAPDAKPEEKKETAKPK